MKVLHVINGLGSGGAEKLLSDILPLLNKVNDMEVELLLLTDKNEIYKKMILDTGVKVYVCEPNKLYSFKNLVFIRSLILKNKYNIIHAHLFPTNYYVSLISKTIFRKNISFIFTEHSTHNRRRDKKVFRYLEKVIYSNYNKITSISNQTQQNLIKWLQPRKNYEKFLVIENGVNLKKYCEGTGIDIQAISPKIRKTDKLISMIGRFSHQKDQDTLIKAMTLLDHDVHLLLIGEGEFKSKCIDLAKKLGVDERVHFLGFRKDVHKILQSIDIAILSSKWEGFGLAALEAMATKKPVIASDVDGLREVIGRNDLIFPVGDHVKLAKIINQLFSDVKYYNKVSEDLFERSKQYDINTTLHKLTNLYLNIVENSFRKS